MPDPLLDLVDVTPTGWTVESIAIERESAVATRVRRCAGESGPNLLCDAHWYGDGTDDAPTVGAAGHFDLVLERGRPVHALQRAIVVEEWLRAGSSVLSRVVPSPTDGSNALINIDDYAYLLIICGQAMQFSSLTLMSVV